MTSCLEVLDLHDAQQQQCSNLGYWGNPSYSFTLMPWPTALSKYPSFTQRDDYIWARKRLKTGDFSLENWQFLLDLRHLHDAVDCSTRIGAFLPLADCFKSTRFTSNQHGETDRQHGNLQNWGIWQDIQSFGDTKWTLFNWIWLNRMWQQTRKKVRSQHFQANGRTIFSWKIIKLWHYSLELDNKTT